MTKKVIYIIGSALIGIITLLTVMLILLGTGVISGVKDGLLFRSSDIESVYTGQPIKLEEARLSTGTIKDGHTINYHFTGERTEVGESSNDFTVTITDAAGTDVTEEYNIYYRPGTIKVTHIPLELKALDMERQFNGKPLTGSEYEIVSGALAEGDVLEPIFGGTQTYVGSCENSFSAIVKNKEGADVSGNYKIKTTGSTLTVIPAVLQIKSRNYEDFYDGKGHEQPEAEIIVGALAEGHEMKCTFAGAVINAGEYDNDFAVTIYDQKGVDMMSNYEIEKVVGKLRIIPRGITIRSEGLSKRYDGNPISTAEDAYDVLKLDLLPGHNINWHGIKKSLTEAGEIDNVPDFSVTTAAGVNVTENYKLVGDGIGKLIIEPINVIISTPDHMTTYTGKKTSFTEYTVENPEVFLAGHSISSVAFSAEASALNVGVFENKIVEVRVKDSSGHDVTKNYTFDLTKYGSIITLPLKITIRSASALKEFDGKPLTSSEYQIVQGALAEGHSIEVNITGMQLEIGESKNTIGDVTITDGVEILTDNYEIVLEEGTLKVTGTAPGSGGGVGESGNIGGSGGGSGWSGSGGSNGQVDESGNIGGSGGGSKEKIVFKVKTATARSFYLRYRSYGDYTGTNWESAASYGKTLPGGYSYNYLTSVALKNAGYLSSYVEIESATGKQFHLPSYTEMSPGGNYSVPKDDVKYPNNGSSNYSMYVYNYKGNAAELAGNLGELSALEEEYRQFVYENYLTVDADMKQWLLDFFADKNLDASDPDIISRVATVIQSCATYDEKYGDKTNLDSAEDMVKCFLSEAKMGVCRHYASSATLLFRALGIPARYTIGYSTNKISANVWTSVMSDRAHAWVEVYVDGVGWVHVEVTGGAGNAGGSSSDEQTNNPLNPGIGGEGGTGGEDDTGGAGGESGETLEALTITPLITYAKWDGEFHEPVQEVVGLEHLLGYTCEVVISGARKNAGVGETKIEKFVLYDPDGNDVTDKFDITKQLGTIQIVHCVITLRSGSASKVYDGKPLSSTEVELLEGSLMASHTMEYYTTVKAQNVGKYANMIYVKILDANKNDITHAYQINKEIGTLEITYPDEIVIQSRSADKPYDGTELTLNKFDIIEGENSLVEGHTLEVAIEGSQLEVGRSDNTITDVRIKDENQNDVTKNYKISTIDGTLKITR